MFNDNPALYYAILLSVAVLGWFARELFRRKNGGDESIDELKANFATFKEKQETHRIQMEQHRTASDRFAEKQTQLLEEMARMLGRIEIHTDITAKGMLENRRTNGDLAEAIQKLSAYVSKLK